MTKQAGPEPTSRGWFRPTLSTWLVGVPVVVLMIAGLAAEGLPLLLSLAGVTGIITSLYVLVSGRRSWASIPSRRIAGFVLLASLTLAIAGGATRAAPEPSTPTAAVAPISAGSLAR